MTDWRELLRAEVARSSTTKVAAELGVSRTQVSLVLQGKYAEMGGREDRLEEKVLAAFGWVICPHTRHHITNAACAKMRSAPVPTSDPETLKHWIACRGCRHNPEKKENAAC